MKTSKGRTAPHGHHEPTHLGHASHAGHNHAAHEPTHITKKLGPAHHDNPGYHHIQYGHHRLNVGQHRLEYINKPCKNRHCRSYGSSHPNCKCYGHMAKGGEVQHFCDSEHEHDPDCDFYKSGGEVSNLNKGLNLSNFKKIKEDKKTVTMAHPSGHKIVIAKSALPHIQRKQLEKLPVHKADGGDISSGDSSDQAGASASLEDPSNAIEAQGSNMPAVESPDDEENVPSPAVGSAGMPASTSSPVPSNAPSTTPGSMPSGVPDASLLNANSIYQQGMRGIVEKGQAEAGLAQQTANTERDLQQTLQDDQRHFAYTNMAMQKNVNDALADIKAGHINPKQYLENMGTPQKVATAIGLILGGFQGGFNRTGVNPAADWLTGQINKDIDAQKANLNTKQNIYNAYMQQFQNAQVAEQMTRATHLGIYASQIRQAAAKAGTPMAKSNGDIAASELERNMLPLVNNAHLLNQFATFNSGANGNGSPGSGTESQYQTALNAAQNINPALYSDQQSKYVPGVGVASHPVPGEDRERLTKLNDLIPLIEKTQNDQKGFGMLGAQISMHPISNQATAASDYNALHVKLNNLTGLNRLNDQEYKNYGEQIGDIGQPNWGGTAETIKNLHNQAIMDRNSLMTSMGIKPFVDWHPPTGLSNPQQNNLNTFLKNNPHVDPQSAQKILKDKGLL